MKCRVCKGNLYKEPLLVYKNMPNAAQHLPDELTVSEDVGITLKICQCKKCGLVQLDNEPVDYYKDVIRAVGISEKMYKFRKQQFSEFVEKYNLENAKIIEVGAGHGEYLSIMKECNTDACGIENSLKNIELANQLYTDLNIKKGYIDKDFISPFDEKFDAFFTLNFLEHMPDPNSMFEKIYNILKPGGIGLIEVPNFDMNIRNNLFSEFVRDHLFYFTKESLGTLIKTNGFEILESSEVWHGYMLSMVIKRRESLELSAFRGCELKLQEDMDKYLKKYNNVAIWGAGHQALTVFSMANLGDRIKYVVDSADFKQDKFTPVTHMRIVAPSRLKDDPVDAIIVIAGGYTDSVVSKIRAMKLNIKIATLDNYRVREL